MELPAVALCVGARPHDQRQAVTVVEGLIFDAGHVFRDPEGVKARTAGKRPAADISMGGGLTNIKRMVEEKKGRFSVEAKEQFKMILIF